MTAHQYLGGPLDGQPAEKTGPHWEHFRHDTGAPMDEQEGRTWMDAAERGGPSTGYYWTSRTGGACYVHLSVFWPWYRSTAAR